MYEPDIGQYEQQVSDTLANAWEGGGVAYWARVDETVEPSEPTDYLHDYPLKGGSVTLEDIDGAKHVLGGEALRRGLQVMLAKHPRQYAEMITEGGDARTAHIYVQCCLYGELVYS